MKNILIILISILFFSCNHDIPIANIQFIKIEKNDKYENSFFLYFKSDVELIENLQKEHLGARVDCFFKNERVNKRDYADYKGFILSSVGDLELISKKDKYTYKIKTFFEQEGIEKYSNNPIKQGEIILKKLQEDIDKQTECANCAVTAVTFMNTTKRYISNTMCLPKTEIKKVLK
ncbi:hypothetical protein [Tenacibaculum sp. A30]|uniref:hypothetical protein n=1 Tax=Tenacibaculum sp. A30 TaxID=3442644 RepID=UPI003EBD2CBE